MAIGTCALVLACVPITVAETPLLDTDESSGSKVNVQRRTKDDSDSRSVSVTRALLSSAAGVQPIAEKICWMFSLFDEASTESTMLLEMDPDMGHTLTT